MPNFNVPTCCPFHVDGGDPQASCAFDIPKSHFDFVEIELRLLALAADRRSLDIDPAGRPRNATMREEFALFYGGTQPALPPVDTGRRK